MCSDAEISGVYKYLYHVFHEYNLQPAEYHQALATINDTHTATSHLNAWPNSWFHIECWNTYKSFFICDKSAFQMIPIYS